MLFRSCSKCNAALARMLRVIVFAWPVQLVLACINWSNLGVDGADQGWRRAHLHLGLLSRFCLLLAGRNFSTHCAGINITAGGGRKQILVDSSGFRMSGIEVGKRINEHGMK